MTQYVDGERIRLSPSTRAAVEYLERVGQASLQDIVRAIAYKNGAHNLSQALRIYAENHGKIHQVTICGKAMGTWRYREPVVSERARRSLLTLPALDVRCLGRPIIVVR